MALCCWPFYIPVISQDRAPWDGPAPEWAESKTLEPVHSPVISLFAPERDVGQLGDCSHRGI